MILHNSINNVNTNLSSSPFTIKTSSKAFKILSDNLYADKFAAVIREYSTNAYDSHMAAGKADTPFEVHLPTNYEPWFSVRDFGTGISDEAITSLFTSYFDSDKSGRNDLVGALGLGSKSAFAYTDSFTVESYYNGKYSIYSCFISEDGTPKIAKIHDEETTIDNGVNIKISVKKNDYYEFSSRAEKIYSFFKTLPIITGEQINIKVEPELTSGNGWKISKIGSYEKYRGALAVMGNIAYPLDSGKLTNLSAKHDFILKNAFRIDFSIGELDIVASREYLSYDSQTIKNIKSRLDSVFDNVYDFIVSEVRKQTTPWLATKCFYTIVNNWNLEAFNSLPIFYKGELLKKQYTLDINKFKDIAFIKFIYEGNGFIKKIDMHKYHISHFDFIPDNQIFVFKDEDKERVSASKARSLVIQGKSVIYMSLYNKEIIDTLGGAEYTLVSSIEKPKSQPSISKKAPKPFILMCENGFFEEHSSLTFKDLPDGKIFYIPINRFKPLDGNNKMANSSFSELVKSARDLEVIDKDIKIYGVLGFALNKIKNDRFVNALNFIRANMENAISKWVESIKIYHKCKNAVDVWHNVSENIILFKAWEENKLIVNPGSKLFSIFAKVSDYKTIITKSLKDDPRFAIANKLAFKSNIIIDLEKDEIENVKVEYPMLEFFGSYANRWNYTINNNAKAVQEYINMVDNK